MQVVLAYLQSFRRNSFSKCVSNLEITKNYQNPYIKSLRSFKVIDVDTPIKLVVIPFMISSMSVPICNHFHARQANSGKIT